MYRLLGWIGLFAGSWIGWIVGEQISFFAAVIFSGVGAAVGMYLGRVLSRRWF